MKGTCAYGCNIPHFIEIFLLNAELKHRIDRLFEQECMVKREVVFARHLGAGYAGHIQESFVLSSRVEAYVVKFLGIC